MNKVNPFPVFTAYLLHNFLSKLSIADEAALVANLGKIFTAKGTARSISAFLPDSVILQN